MGALALVVPGAAQAVQPPRATPQQIYRDITDNGRLDRAYREADIERALRVSSEPVSPERERRVTSAPAPDDGAATGVAARDVILRDFPFSKLDLVLLGSFGGLLLLIGAGFRLGHGLRASTGPSDSITFR